MNKTMFKGSAMLNPVPVVLIASKNNAGLSNVFTVAWAGTICTNPPMVSISIRKNRLSYEYINETREFTLNMPSYSLVKETDFCGVRSGRDLDKIKEMNFTMKDSSNIKVPYIDECLISLECRVKQIIELGTHDLFISEVLSSHVDDSIIDETGKIHFEKANLMCYCHGEYFPMSKDAIGKFGFSVVKNKNLKNKYKIYDDNFNKLINPIKKVCKNTSKQANTSSNKLKSNNAKKTKK